MPQTTTATELQRNYREVVKKAKKLKEPVTVLSNNKPELVVMDYDVFKTLQNNILKQKKRPKRSLEELFGLWTKKEAKEFNEPPRTKSPWFR